MKAIDVILFTTAILFTPLNSDNTIQEHEATEYVEPFYISKKKQEIELMRANFYILVSEIQRYEANRKL